MSLSKENIDFINAIDARFPKRGIACKLCRFSIQKGGKPSSFMYEVMADRKLWGRKI